MGKNQYKLRFELEELKEILGVSEKYQQYAGFKMRVLDEAQQRLAEKTDIGFKYDEIKAGKKVTALTFHIYNNKNKEIPQTTVTNTPKSDEEQENLILELTPIVVKKFGVSLKVFMSLVEKYTEGEVRKAVQITEKALQENKVDNAAGFFVEALRGGYEDSAAQKKQAEAQKVTEKKAKIEALKKEKQIEEDNKKQFLRTESERKLSIIKVLIAEKPDLVYEAIEQLTQGMFGNSYDRNKSIEENINNPMLAGGLMNILQKLEPTVFD
jgi:hypothetical protein